MNYTNGQTELNLYCQSKIIRLENQNTKPNLAFNERFFLSYRSPGFPTLSFVPLLFLTLFLVPAHCAAHQLYLHFWPIFFVLFKTILFACSVVWWLCVCAVFSSNGIHFLINFRTFVFIYLTDYFYCCRFASPMHPSHSIEFENLFSDIVVLWRTHTNTNATHPSLCHIVPETA